MHDSNWISSFNTDGYAVIPQLLSSSEFEELNRELARYIREVVPRLPDADAFYHNRNDPGTLKQLQHMGCDPYFQNYRLHPVWNRLAWELLGEPANPSSSR